jgi:hypothetical protein
VQGGVGDIGTDKGHANGVIQPASKGDDGDLSKGHLQDAQYGNLWGTRSGGLGVHVDGDDPVMELSGLTGIRGHSYRGSGRDSTGGDLQGAAGGGTILGTRGGVLLATSALLYTGEDGGMSTGDDVFRIDSGVPNVGTTQGGVGSPAGVMTPSRGLGGRSDSPQLAVVVCAAVVAVAGSVSSVRAAIAVVLAEEGAS